MKKIIENSSKKKILLIFNIIILSVILILGNVIKAEPYTLYCPDWPTCFGQITIPDQSGSLWHFLHRSLSAVVFILSSFLFIGVLSTKDKTLREIVFSSLTVTSLVIQIFIGYLIIQDLIIASVFHYLLMVVTIIFSSAWLIESMSVGKSELKFPKHLIYLFFSTLGLVLIGTLVTYFRPEMTCSDILCLQNFAQNPLQLTATIHRIWVVVVLLQLLHSLRQIWIHYRQDITMLISITSAFTLFIFQIILGMVQISRDFPFVLTALHSVSAIGFIFAVSISYFKSCYTIPTIEPVTKTIFNDVNRRKDFLKLNKPIIVLLLLVTTYAGMVVGGKQIPDLVTTFWTLLAGALAAGGSSAINQYLDREIDQSMQRTASRPLPSKRLLPAEAFALGFSEILASFFIYAVFVNMIAAVLAMLGMIYYVFIYSMWLKHATVQNIVIGGGAGAIPPLVGWAAATGSLNIPSLFLFALVFLWTPPHFWALALIRKNDYARAKVPMLPVIKGEKNTRKQIFIYTIQLVVLTLIMPFFNVGGGLYFVAAILLGLWLLRAAWQVLKVQGNKVAYKMYRYSSMYLAFIFFALVIDVLV